MGKFFRAMHQVENAINQAKYGTDPRPLDDRDHEDWQHSLDNPKPTFRSKEQVVAAIRRKNPYRWKEYRKSRIWVRRTMADLGLNPEDERFLL